MGARQATGRNVKRYAPMISEEVDSTISMTYGIGKLQKAPPTPAETLTILEIVRLGRLQ